MPTSSPRNTRITTFYRTPINEKDWNLPKKDLLQLNIYRRNHKTGREESQYSQEPHAQVGNPQTGEELHLQSFSPRREGSEPHISLPRPAVLGQEYETPEHLSLKACGAYFWESQRAVGNRVSTFKGCTQKSHLLQDQGRSCHLPVA